MFPGLMEPRLVADFPHTDCCATLLRVYMSGYHVISAFLRGFRPRTWLDIDGRGRGTGALYVVDHLVSR